MGMGDSSEWRLSPHRAVHRISAMFASHGLQPAGLRKSSQTERDSGGDQVALFVEHRVPPERTPLGWHSSERRRASGRGNPLSSMAGIVFAAFKPSSAATFPHGFSAQLAASRRLQPAGMRRVEVWRGGVRLSMSVSAPFVWRCLSGSAVAPFPHPAHRTGQADFPHPALGQDLTPSFACDAIGSF